MRSRDAAFVAVRKRRRAALAAAVQNCFGYVFIQDMQLRCGIQSLLTSAPTKAWYAGRWRRACYLTQRRGGRPDLLEENLQPQRAEILAIVAVIHWLLRSGAWPAFFHPALILVQPLAGALVD